MNIVFLLIFVFATAALGFAIFFAGHAASLMLKEEAGTPPTILAEKVTSCWWFAIIFLFLFIAAVIWLWRLAS